MGFAVPAALGVALACPEDTVWVVVGDGGFQMTMCELATIVQEHIDINVAIINNGYLGMVRQWQQFFHGRRYSATPIWSPDYARLAEAYGVTAFRAKEPTDVGDLVREAIALDRPVLIEVPVGRMPRPRFFAPRRAPKRLDR